MKSVNLPERTFVRVVWKDSNFAAGWNNRLRLTASVPSVTTEGRVTFNDAEILELSNTFGDEGARLNPLSIPWRSIVSLEKCNLVKEE
jgi:hypothetical protein